MTSSWMVLSRSPKMGLSGVDAVVASPDGAGSGLGFEMPSAGGVASADPLFTVDCGALQPCCGCVDRCDDLRRWVRQLHEVEQDVGALSGGEGDGFVVASGDWRERQGIVLLRPDGRVAVDDDLRCENVGECVVGAGCGLLAQVGGDEGVVAGAGRRRRSGVSADSVTALSLKVMAS